MKYLGGTIKLSLVSTRTIEEDMKMYRELREVAERLVRKYGVEIDMQHDPCYEPTHETLSMLDVESPFE